MLTGLSDVYTIKTSNQTELYASQRLSRNTNQADPTFKLGEVYAFPNPAKNGKNPIIHAETGLADKLDLAIYNIAGELIETSSIDGTRWKIVDSKYCYEWEWNTTNIASATGSSTGRPK